MTRPAPVRSALLACVLTMLLSLPSLAGPTDLYGAYARGMGTAGTETAGADDSTAVLYNPAGIALAGASGKAELQLGYAYGQPFMHIHRQQNDAASLQAHPTSLPPGEGWITLGATAPLGGKIRHRASLGFAFYLPQNNIIKVQAIDPGNPQWLRYQGDPDRLVLAMGLGIRVSKYVAVGIGAELLAGITGTVDFNIDIANRKVNQRNVDFALTPGLSPNIGVTVMPLQSLRLSLVFRGPLQLNYTLPNKLNIDGLGVDLGITGTALYTPPQFAFGAQYAPTDRWKLGFDLKYDMWSRAPFPGLQVNVSLSGDVAQGLGLDQLGFQTQAPPMGFKDTLTPSLSVEYAFLNQGISVRAGYCLRPPYAPQQVGSTNFLDSLTHIVGAGATFAFRDPIGVFSAPLMLDIGAQFQATQAVTIVKAQSGDAVGNYDYGGFAVAGAADLRYDF